MSTEGYSPDEDNILAWALAPLDRELPYIVYVRGGDPDKNGNVNMINKEAYQTLAVEPAVAWEAFAALYEKADFVLCHSAPFARSFLDKLRLAAGPDAPTVDYGKIVDTLTVARALGKGTLPLLEACSSVADVSREIAGMVTAKRADSSCGLKAIAARMDIRVEDTGPLCERNAVLLRKVFLRMLEQPC